MRDATQEGERYSHTVPLTLDGEPRYAMGDFWLDTLVPLPCNNCGVMRAFVFCERLYRTPRLVQATCQTCNATMVYKKGPG